MSDETPMSDPDGFDKIMRRLDSMTPEQRILLAAETELAIAWSAVEEERFVAGLLDDQAIDRLIDDLDRE